MLVEQLGEITNKFPPYMFMYVRNMRRKDRVKTRIL